MCCKVHSLLQPRGICAAECAVGGTRIFGASVVPSRGDAMKAVSFLGLCRVTFLNYVDRLASNVHRHVADTDAEFFPPAAGEPPRRKRFASVISARRVFRLRAGVKAPVRKPLAGVGVNVDD